MYFFLVFSNLVYILLLRHLIFTKVHAALHGIHCINTYPVNIFRLNDCELLANFILVHEKKLKIHDEVTSVYWK